MIQKMKKLSFITLDSQYDAFLERLRDIGVIHITEKNCEADAHLEKDIESLSRYRGILTRLEDLKAPANTDSASENPIQEYDRISHDIECAHKELVEMTTLWHQIEPWGEYDLCDIEKLGEEGHPLRFYTCQTGIFKDQWEHSYNAIIINSEGGNIYFVTIGKEMNVPGVTEHKLPKASVSETNDRIAALQKKLQDLHGELVRFAGSNIEGIKLAITDLENRIDFKKVRESAENACEGHVKVLSGWAPAKFTDSIRESLQKENCIFEINDPDPEDDIPIVLRNNAFFKMFEPLTRLYMLPKYGELDLTPYFAPFFLLFFGLCLGDFGYGILIIVGLPIFLKLFKLINPDFSKGLVLLFGISTMLCGLLSGSFFGFNLYSLNIPFIQKVKELLYTDSTLMFTLSLEIGVVQILFGMAIKAVNKAIQFGFKYAVSTIGWLILLLTVIVAVLSDIGFSNPVIIALLSISACAIFLYNSPGKNPLLNIGLGLWDSYNMATGLLGDVLSYVRLFALGLSGGILATVFNSMAEGMSPDVPVVGFLVTALIFVIGHGLNIFMGILGAVVHPMRLTFVEFFKNAGYEGGGTEYKPFKQK